MTKTDKYLSIYTNSSNFTQKNAFPCLISRKEKKAKTKIGMMSKTSKRTFDCEL